MVDRGVIERAMELPTRNWSGVVWNGLDPKQDPLKRQPRASYAARAHQRGQPEPLYTSPTSHLIPALEKARYVDPGEEVHPVMLLSELGVSDLPIVDYANNLALMTLGVKRDDLTRDHDLELPQALADVARGPRHPALGVMLPSAAHPAAETLVIFPEGIADHVAILDQKKVQVTIAVTTVP